MDCRFDMGSHIGFFNCFLTNVEFSQAVLKNLTGVVKVLAVIGVIVAFLADIVAIFY